MKRKLFLLVTISLFISVLFLTEQLNAKSTETQVQKNAAKIDYKDVRIRNFPLAVQCWTFRKFTFFEALKRIEDLGIKYVQAFPGQKLSNDLPGVKFDHNLNDKMINLVKEKLQEHGLKLVSYGVVNFDNTEKSMEKVFGFARTMGIRTIVTEPKYDDYSLIEKMVRKYNILIAIHNHPQPSKYAFPRTVLDHVKNLDRRIGSCADTGHWLRSGVVPVEAFRLLKGRIIDVHLKDLNEFGVKKAYDVPFGQGKANIHDILAELTLQNYHGYLTIEHENKDEIDNPSPSIMNGIEYIRSITYYDEDCQELLKWHNGRYSKHGWNHYGPGYFILNEKEGILKSQGGMGLFWYSEKKFKDFTLYIDFKCSQNSTNSGIFLRIPDVVTSNEYIFHSFEIQIDNMGKGAHKTGSVYDAEPPLIEAWKPVGEWNHYKITFKGDHLTVELNDKLIIDWDAEPRGKVRDFAKEGYIGLQNHDSMSPVYFKNIFIKEL